MNINQAFIPFNKLINFNVIILNNKNENKNQI